MTAIPRNDESQLNKLLNWLDADRAAAGEKYEEIRKRLIKIFVVRGSLAAEELADVTIERVTNKVFEIADTYVGEPALYFYGVAQNVFLESLRKPKQIELPISLKNNQNEMRDDESERRFTCLDSCLQKLKKDQRQLILGYYKNEKKTKINNRKRIAENQGITLETLRIRAYRIRETLQKCLGQCLKSK